MAIGDQIALVGAGAIVTYATTWVTDKRRDRREDKRLAIERRQRAEQEYRRRYEAATEALDRFTQAGIEHRAAVLLKDEEASAGAFAKLLASNTDVLVRTSWLLLDRSDDVIAKTVGLREAADEAFMRQLGSDAAHISDGMKALKKARATWATAIRTAMDAS